jgi:hypothetical protein
MPSKLKPVSEELVPLDFVRRALLDPTVRLSVTEEDPATVQRRMIERTLNATSVDDLWGTDVVHARDMIGRSFILREVEWRNSEIEESEGGLSIFAVMHGAFVDTGEMAIMTCGAVGVVSRLFKLVEFDALPIAIRIRSTKTKGGYNALDLEPAPEPF